MNLMRACIHSARIVLADEPTASLDAENAGKTMEMLHRCTKGKLLVVVTHDPESLKDFDRIIIMEKLQPIFVGNYEEVQKSTEYQRWLKQNIR